MHDKSSLKFLGQKKCIALAFSFFQMSTIIKTEPTVEVKHEAPQHIYIIQTTDGSIPVEASEVMVADETVYETVSALEQLSRGQVISTEGGELLQVYEEVVLPDGGTGELVDVAEVEVGDGRSASPVKIGALTHTGPTPKSRKRKNNANTVVNAPVAANTVNATMFMVQQDNDDDSDAELAAVAAARGGEFHICRICNQFVPVGQLAQHNHENHSTVSDLTCTDCGKLFKSKRSLFGHRKEKHSGVMEVHTCPECGKTFGRKSNLKAHRESLHYGKKFPCVHCDRIFTNRSSMNQHIKKTHMTTETAINLLTAGGVNVAGINQITGN